ncbi:SOS response-associated peptidase, partial [Escherichia coli]|nr:SOS response-associated peptidase [Escherichia coli]
MAHSGNIVTSLSHRFYPPSLLFFSVCSQEVSMCGRFAQSQTREDY